MYTAYMHHLPKGVAASLFQGNFCSLIPSHFPRHPAGWGGGSLSQSPKTDLLGRELQGMGEQGEEAQMRCLVP